MMKDYTVLDGMINNQGAVLKAAYDRGYTHGLADGIERATTETSKEKTEKYDEGFRKGYEAGSDAVMEHVVKNILDNTSKKNLDGVEVVTKDVIQDALEYIERLIHSGLGKQKSLEYLKKFIESEATE